MATDLQSILESSAAAPPTSTPTPKTRRGLKKVDLVLIGIAAIALIGTAAIALSLQGSANSSTSFQFSMATTGCSTSLHTLSVPSGTQAQFAWSSAHGSMVLMSVIDPTGQTVYSLNATTGYGSFSSDGGSYTFQAQSCSSDTVSITGSLSASNPD